MSKNVLRLLFLSLIVLVSACAHRRPLEEPVADGRELAAVLAERAAISDIETTFGIVFEKNESEMTGDAALDISRSGDMSLRVYTLGFLAMELSSVDGIVKSSPKVDRNKSLILTRGLRDCLFWWDIREYEMQDDGDMIRLKNTTRELWVDRKTLLPKRQKISFDDGKVLTVIYNSPVKTNGIWYPSKIRIELLKYAVTLTLKTVSFKS